MPKQGSLAVFTFLIFVAGCGGSQKPNPLPPEEPMDKSGSSASDSTTPTTTAASTNDSSASSADPSAGLAMSDPSTAGAGATPTPTPASDTSDSDSKGKGKGKGKGKKGKGAKGELSAAECQSLSNKGIELLGASMGMTDPSMMAQLKQQAAGDPNFAGMQTECVKSTTRAQYKCGMSATSKDAWEACLK